MAFCPHCGKSVTDQASKCLACGKEFEPRAKAARFKGTMMMTPAAVPLPKQAEPAKEPPKPAAAPAPAPAAPAAAAPAPAARAAAPSKVAKQTMLGTGGMGLAPPPQMAPARAPTPAPAQPPPAAGSLQPPPPARDSIAPVPKPAAAPAAAAPAPAAPAPAPAAAKPASVWDESAMANTDRPPASDAPSYASGSPSAPRAAFDHSESDTRESLDAGAQALPTHKVGLFIALGVGGLMAIAAAGYFIARMLGI